MIPLCRAEGVAIIPWSPLARGLLAGARASLDDTSSTTRAGSDAYAQRLYDDPTEWSVIEAVGRVAAERGITRAEVALAWLLGAPGVTAPIVGATKLSHLDAAIRAVDLRLSEEERSALEAPYRPHAVRGHSY